MMNNPSNNEKEINRFYDIFHQFHDDSDEDDDKNVDFDNFYTYTGKDNDDNDDDVNAGATNILMDMKATTEEEKEEEHLSQKLSQLSASGQDQTKGGDHESTVTTTVTTTKKRPSLTPTPTTTTTTTAASSSVMKKFKTNQDNPSVEWMSNYLSSTNGTFDEMLRPLLLKKTFFKYIDIEDLRQFAIIMHNMKCIELDQSLWNTYLKSGTGKLNQQQQQQQQQQKIQWWPMEIKIRMIERAQTTIKNPKEIDDESCLDYVQRVLLKFDQQTVFYQEQLKTIKERLRNSMTEEIENAIITFVQQQGISLYRAHIDRRIAGVEYDYKDQLILLEFYKERPNRNQKEVFENLFQLKRETEQAKLDIAILKQRLVYKHLPKSFDSLRIPTPIDLTTIHDVNLRQHLNEQCQKILQRTTSDMMLVYIAIAETKYNEWQTKFDKAMNDMKKNLTREFIPEKLNQSMLDTLHRRFKNLDERLITFYNLKLHFFEQAPTVMN
ncbi:unnamed protein product [Rotaria socialis]|uniref:Uncharacterized protein n=1 Tax=Rotaria socialis TaxID=392032 RepID=A0A818G901_9BILA|nr:unnamed protein product [Rotaria socialis]CAF4915053.1 unnamed protein product [Rotaria socialis]